MTTAVNQNVNQDSWWLVQDSNGAIGLVRGNVPSNAITSIFVGVASDFNTLLNNFSGSLAHAQGKLFSMKGVTQVQKQVFASQIDAGAGLHNPNWIYVGSTGQASSNVQTATGSEAQGTSLIPGTSGIVNALSNFSISGLLGSLSFWKGIGLIVGGALLLVFAALELKNL